ncbi:MAG TPA: DUF4157 domain-containing protein [Haliangium sp.]|nr:DUF4157 domain-containing protein [Haliangium sp.]
MKLPSSERATTTQTRRAARQDTADDRQARAMDPPAYGIDLVDRTSQTRRTGAQDMSASNRAMSMAPPAYGIDLVDRGLTDAASMQPGAETLQRKTETPPGHSGPAWAPRGNETGMPDRLKSGVESLSGLSMDDVRVHYDSARPAPLQALAYTQGTDIHIASGQEQHLPHEAWHVVQQKQGRVEPTMELGGTAINDDAALEREADVMGARAARGLSAEWQPQGTAQAAATPQSAGAGGTSQLRATRPVVQRTWNHLRQAPNDMEQIRALDDAAPLIQAFGPAPDLAEKRLYLARLLITSAQNYDDAAIRDVWLNMNEAQLNARYYQEYMVNQHGWGGEQEAHLIATHYGFSLEIQVGGRRWPIGAGNAINTHRLAWVNANHYVVVNAVGAVVHDPAEQQGFVSGDCLFHSLAYIFNQVDAGNHPAPDAARIGVLRARANQEMQQGGGAAQQGAELLAAAMKDEAYDPAELLNDQLSKGNDAWKKGSTWATMKEESATLAHSQRFGVEVEFNFAKIPYDLTKDFKAFAIAYGHLGIMEHKTLPIEMHLDHADTKNAKIELVSRPQSLAGFIETLKELKKMMRKKPNLKKDFDWIERSNVNMDIKAIKEAFTGYQKFGSLEFKQGEQPVQVTTTHTASELQRVMKAVPEQLYPAQAIKWDTNYRESVSLRTLYDRKQLTEANVIKWLGLLSAVKERGPMNFPVKGSDVLLKHAQEQFVSAPKDRRARVKDETQADRIFHLEDPSKKTKFASDKAFSARQAQLNNLHVLANKMAPVFKRKSGDIAFVMEYRVNSVLATAARDFLIGTITEEAFKALLQKYNQGG